MYNYYDAVKNWWDAQGLSSDDLKPLENALDAWKTSFPAHRAAQQLAQAARQAKDAARAALQAAARPITNFIQSYPATTNADRATIGITVRDAGAAPAPPPTTRPQAVILSGQRLLHTLRIYDEATPTRRARPRGVLGAEVWVKLVTPGNTAAGAAPANAMPHGAAIAGASANATSHGMGGNGASANLASSAAALGDPATFSFLTMTTRPSFRAEFPPAAGGKTAVYMLRWVSTRGEKGPWSEVATATVAA